MKFIGNFDDSNDNYNRNNRNNPWSRRTRSVFYSFNKEKPNIVQWPDRHPTPELDNSVIVDEGGETYDTGISRKTGKPCIKLLYTLDINGATVWSDTDEIYKPQKARTQYYLDNLEGPTDEDLGNLEDLN